MKICIFSVWSSLFRQSVSVYGHYIDSKREGSTVTVVIPAYQQSCFEVTVEDTAAPLQFKMHTTTRRIV